MKVINPKHLSKVEQFANERAADIENYLTARAGEREISFDQIREDFPAVKDPKTGKAPMTDGTLAAIFQKLGYQVAE